MAAAVVYLARKNILEADSPYEDRAIVPQIWPEEMLVMTRCTEDQAIAILMRVLQQREDSDTQNSESGMFENQSA